MSIEHPKANIMEAIAEKTPRKIAKLEGLWKDLPFDIKDEDIRQARHELTEQLEKRQEKL